MALTISSMLPLGTELPKFSLPNTVDGSEFSTNSLKKMPTLIMFICNHCPYVKSVINRIVEDVIVLKDKGVGVAAIMSNDVNDPKYGAEDSFDNMKLFSDVNNFVFPYIYDKTQIVGRNYNAVCTPDFFGFNNKDELQYRGRLEESKMEIIPGARKELLEAMIQVSETGEGPKSQIPSIGCSIKWKE